jgi:hypothetical protein
MITKCPNCQLTYQIEPGHVGTSMTCQSCNAQFTIVAEPEPEPGTETGTQGFAPPSQPQPPQPPYGQQQPPYGQQQPPYGPGTGVYGQGMAQGGGFPELIAKLAPKPLLVSTFGLVVAVLLVISIIVFLVRALSLPAFGLEVFLIFFMTVGFFLFSIGAFMLIYNTLVKQEELLKKLVDKKTETETKQ